MKIGGTRIERQTWIQMDGWKERKRGERECGGGGGSGGGGGGGGGGGMEANNMVESDCRLKKPVYDELKSTKQEVHNWISFIRGNIWSI